jgi:hypothetical protein
MTLGRIPVEAYPAKANKKVFDYRGSISEIQVVPYKFRVFFTGMAHFSVLTVDESVLHVAGEVLFQRKRNDRWWMAI